LFVFFQKTEITIGIGVFQLSSLAVVLDANSKANHNKQAQQGNMQQSRAMHSLPLLSRATSYKQNENHVIFQKHKKCSFNLLEMK